MIEEKTASLAINAQHVAQQFARREYLKGARFILDEIAQRMMERLHYIRIEPEVLIDMGCGPGFRQSILQERYPKAHYIGVDHCEKFILYAREQSKQKGLKKWFKPSRSEFVFADMAKTNLAPESAQMIWSNLALHWHPAPHFVMREWRRLLKLGGLCMFSCFGPRTLIELRQAVQKAGLQTQTMPFVDMHDFGDLMIDNGFLDPVMDQEMLVLTYKTPEKLLEDVYHLGGNPHPERAQGLRGREWRHALLDALEQGRRDDGLLQLTLEVAYGHAWRGAITQGAQAGEVRVSLASLSRR